MIRTGKLLVYQLLRSQGIRLYASSSRTNVLPVERHETAVDGTEVLPVIEVEEQKISRFTRFQEQLGLKGELRYYPTLLLYTGCRLYVSASEASIYNKLYEQLSMPNNFETWHQLTTLHLWLVMVRLVFEGREGKIAKTKMLQVFIDDVKIKRKAIGKELGVPIPTDHTDHLYEKFLGSLLHYDEGLLGSDCELAGALWRNFFLCDPNVSAIDIEKMVCYVRKQHHYLNNLDSRSILTNGLIPFLPVETDKIPPQTIKHLEEIKNTNFSF